MRIQFENYGFLRAEERGSAEEEIRMVLETGINIILKYNRLQVTEDIVLDMGEGDKLVGIEILDASRYVHLQKSYAGRV